MKARPNVALIIETSSAYGRQLLHGIARYQRANGGWSVLLDEGAVRGQEPDLEMNRECDGILCRATSPSWAKAIKESKIPVVDLNDRFGYLGIPRVGSDMAAIGRIAVDHMLERGFRQIAFCGYSDDFWSVARLQGVSDALEGRGVLCSAFESPHEDHRQGVWREEREQLCAWLQSLPKPIGIIAGNDVRGHAVLDACRVLDLAVPEEVAVVGVDNAETFCELCDPPLSSVVPNGERIGFEAAMLLDRLMLGQAPEAEESLIPPREVITRQSSDVLAIADPSIAAALRFIREEACEGISIADVLRHVALSRSGLERGFRHYLGHSPQEEIRRIRLKRIKQLLAETDWSLTRIAEMTGFEYANYMMVQFKRSVGQTPSEWRDANRTSYS